jgi:uncharacterized membrane protein YbaN (DUF454 family)
MATPMTANSRSLTAPARWLLQALAGLCLLLGLVGVFVPVMPTVPFLIVAAWAASRSSPRLHQWLMEHPRFGRQLREWNEHGIVPRRAKWFTTVMMAISAVSMLVVAPRSWVPFVLAGVAVMALVLVWLWKRPERTPPGATGA